MEVKGEVVVVPGLGYIVVPSHQVFRKRQHSLTRNHVFVVHYAGWKKNAPELAQFW